MSQGKSITHFRVPDKLLEKIAGRCKPQVEWFGNDKVILLFFEVFVGASANDFILR